MGIQKYKYMKIVAKTEVNAGIYPIDKESNKVANPTIQGSAIVSPGIEMDIFYVDETNNLIFFNKTTHASLGEVVLGVSKETYDKWFTEIVDNSGDQAEA